MPPLVSTIVDAPVELIETARSSGQGSMSGSGDRRSEPVEPCRIVPGTRRHGPAADDQFRHVLLRGLQTSHASRHTMSLYRGQSSLPTTNSVASCAS